MAESPPRFVEPMLATAGALPADEARWAYEVKWDGMRVIARIVAGRLELRNRSGGDVSGRYPELATGVEQCVGRELLLDGEVVALDETGRPSFERLQRRMHVVDLAQQRHLATIVPAHLVVFDALWIDGRSLVRAPYEERRRCLVELDLGHHGWMTPAAGIGQSAPITSFVANHRLEGVVAKRLDSAYQPGTRSSAWIKRRAAQRQELLVCGWIEGTGALSGTIGSLVVGYHDGPDGAIHYAGRVGSGLTRRDATVLDGLLTRLHRITSPITVGSPPAEAHWVEPELVVEVKFTQWTTSGLLRQPVFLGLRDDRDPRRVVKEPQ
jgi:bifunctional non-homologous end joining protein LigD